MANVNDIVASFRQFDIDGNGFIDSQELASVLQTLDKDKWTKEKVMTLLNAIDRNSDGLIDYEEFANWISTNGSAAAFLLPKNTKNEIEKEGEAAAPMNELTFHVQMMGGEQVTLKVDSGGVVQTLKKAMEEVKKCPPDKATRFLHCATILKDSDPLITLPSQNLTVIYTTPEISYLESDDSFIRLIAEGDDGFNEQTAKRAQISPSAWVPAHPDYADCQNFSRQSEGATVTVSSNMWGNGIAGQEKLNNVLRLGSIHGDPRFMQGDNSFIFRENQNIQYLIVTLSQVRTLVRIGSMCYGDRWINRFKVETREEEGGEWVVWGDLRESYRTGGVVYIDRTPTKSRWIRIHTSSGHYHGAGARIGPLFAYGLIDGA